MENPRQPIETMDVKDLKKERYRLLEKIHGKQQELDQIDYQIYQKKKEKEREKQ